jgi:hypothetical protein
MVAFPAPQPANPESPPTVETEWNIVYHAIMHQFSGIAKPAERKNAWKISGANFANLFKLSLTPRPEVASRLHGTPGGQRALALSVRINYKRQGVCRVRALMILRSIR